MKLLRSILLAGSQSAWLRRQATRRRFVRRAVSRFMPGETLDEALAAARSLRERGMGAILTHLGENVTERAEADAVVAHYLELLARVREAGLDAEASVKLTQLGLDLGAELALENTRRIADRARELGNRISIDMEGTPYTDATVGIFRQLRATHENVGLCLQSYLRRTSADLESLLPLGPAIRMVKGAYQEPPHLAFQHKREVDESFFQLCARLLGEDARRRGARLTVGTHDVDLIRRIAAHAEVLGVPKSGYEFALLYGIKREEQARLAREGYGLRVLVSYGSYWFPWYMRRLAERPANVLFVLRNLFAR
jgi:proline dehydrogenase